MLSIRGAGDELDRLDHLARTLANVYDHAIWSTAQYAVEIEPQSVHLFREHLKTLRDQVAQASCAEDWQVVQAAFRGELRDFRDKSSAQLTRLRPDFAAAVDAMQAFADNMAVTGDDHEDDLRNTLGELKQAAQSDDMELVRTRIGRATAEIRASVERMRRAHKLAIAQLRDEIRLLQKQVELERRAAQIDPPTGAWNRQKMEASLATLTDKDEAFSLIIVHVRNLRQIDGQFSRSAIEKAIRALTLRLTGMLDDTAIVGRWDNESFAALLPVEPPVAIRISREAAVRLSGTYAVQEDGGSRQIVLIVVTGVIDHASGTGPAAFAERLEQISNTLAAP